MTVYMCMHANYLNFMKIMNVTWLKYNCMCVLANTAKFKLALISSQLAHMKISTTQVKILCISTSLAIINNPTEFKQFYCVVIDLKCLHHNLNKCSRNGGWCIHICERVTIRFQYGNSYQISIVDLVIDL